MDGLEKLFLLEILVDSVYFERNAIDPEVLEQLQDTITRFQFFDYPPIDIGEIDFCQTGEQFGNSEISFKSGKSILFALPDVATAMKEPFDINVTISRKKLVGKKEPTKEGEESKDEFDLYELGRTVIHLGESFINLMEATSYDGVCPTSRTVRDTYSFCKNSEVVGYITVFVRLSCFGKIIVTQFQADALDEKSFCFKGAEEEPVFDTSPQTKICGGGGGAGGGDPFQQMMPNMFMPSMYPQTVKVPVPLKSRPTEPRCGRVPEHLISSEGGGPYCLNKECPQGYPRPPWVAQGRRKLKQSNLPVGTAGLYGDDILFQMSNPLDPSSIVDRENITYQVDHEPDHPKQDVQIVAPNYQPEADDENDVFLLKFGKHDANGKPAKLIITMKTPKAPLISPHICQSERNTQTDPKAIEVCPSATKDLTSSEIATALGKKSSEISAKTEGKGAAAKGHKKTAGGHKGKKKDDDKSTEASD